MPADERRRALDRAVRALARRDHSAASIRARLSRADVDDETCEDVVETLVRAGYLDDARFATTRASHLAAAGYGDAWIRGDLEAQGVSDELAGEALSALPPERDRALAQAAKLGDPLRAARSLARRGFSQESLEAVLASSVADDPVPGVGYECSI